jgi:CRP-like cAMP-binding protein
MNAGLIANLNIEDLVGDSAPDLAGVLGREVPEIEFIPSDPVFPLRDREPGLLIVASGKIDIFAPPDESTALVKRVGIGTLFGEARPVGMTMLGCRAVAASYCSVLLLDPDAAVTLRDRTAVKWAERQAPMLFDCAWDRNRMKFASTRVRLAALLLELSGEDGFVNGVSQQALASHLGLYRESLAGVLMKLRRDGLVKWTRQGMDVDRSRLAKIVERG